MTLSATPPVISPEKLDRNLDLNITDLKRVIRALVSTGHRYSDIAAKTGIEFNTLKQFAHRKSSSPRKTPVFYALLQFVNNLDQSVIDLLCTNEPSLSYVFWRSDLTPLIKVDEGRDFSGGETWRPIAYAIEKIQALETEFLPVYIAFRPLSESESKVSRSRIELKFTHFGGIEFIHEQITSGAQKQVSGIALVNSHNIYLIGAAGRAAASELILFAFPSKEKPTKKIYMDSTDNNVDQTKYYTHMYGIVLTCDLNSIPIANRIVIVDPQRASSTDVGVVEIEKLNAFEKYLLDYVDKESGVKFTKSKLKAVASRFDF
jgi:hypothetical protein